MVNIRFVPDTSREAENIRRTLQFMHTVFGTTTIDDVCISIWAHHVAYQFVDGDLEQIE